MAKNITLWVIFACVVAAVIGGFIGYAWMPEKVQTITKEVSVPVETIKQVEVNVPLDARATYLKPALKDFIKEAEKEDDFVYCDNKEYDEDQIKFKSDPNNWNVEIGKDKTIVSFDTRLKYLDKDVEEKCYRDYSVKVLYEDGEKPQVDF